MIFPAEYGSLQVSMGRDYDTQQIPFRMWVFPVWRGAWINPEVCFPFPQTPEGDALRFWLRVKCSVREIHTHPQSSVWSLSRKDESVRMMFLCKQFAQRGNSVPGRKLGNGGLQDCSENLPGCSFPHPHINPEKTEIFWGYKPSGADLPPYKDPSYGRRISREQSGHFYGPSVFFNKCKGAAAGAEDGLWLKLGNHPKTRRGPAPQ